MRPFALMVLLVSCTSSDAQDPTSGPLDETVIAKITPAQLVSAVPDPTTAHMTLFGAGFSGHSTVTISDETGSVLTLVKTSASPTQNVVDVPTLQPGHYRLSVDGADPLDVTIGLSGPAGPAGPQGEIGATGATGPQGPQG